LHDVIDAIQILHAAGLRRTPVRTGVIELLAAASRPMAVPDLLGKLPRGTDVVTVYRTLNTLAKKKLARRVRGEDRSWLYELNSTRSDDHLHAHFVCDECGTVECLPEVEAPALPRGLKLARGYDVSKQELTLHGTCAKCK
jgi:Fur family transcriptional regulator, ferric uptake regulator